MGRTTKAVRAAVPAGMAVWAIRDAARHPDHVWDTAGHSKAAWMATIALVPVAGPLLYAGRIRPELDTAETAVALQGG